MDEYYNRHCQKGKSFCNGPIIEWILCAQIAEMQANMLVSERAWSNSRSSCSLMSHLVSELIWCLETFGHWHCCSLEWTCYLYCDLFSVLWFSCCQNTMGRVPFDGVYNSKWLELKWYSKAMIQYISKYRLHDMIHSWYILVLWEASFLSTCYREAGLLCNIISYLVTI